MGTPDDWLRPAAVYVLSQEYNPSGSYVARQNDEIILAATSHEGGEGPYLDIHLI